MKHIPAVSGNFPAANSHGQASPSNAHANVRVFTLLSPKALGGGVLLSEIPSRNSTFLPSFTPHPLRCFHATMKALTPAEPVPRVLSENTLLHAQQVSRIHVPCLPVVLSPTTWCARSSSIVLCGNRDRHPSLRRRVGFGASPLASRLAAATQPNRVRYPTDRRFTSGCSPPHLAVTQLPSVSGPRTRAWRGLAPLGHSTLSVALAQRFIAGKEAVSLTRVA